MGDADVEHPPRHIRQSSFSSRRSDRGSYTFCPDSSADERSDAAEKHLRRTDLETDVVLIRVDLLIAAVILSFDGAQPNEPVTAKFEPTLSDACAPASTDIFKNSR